MKESEWHLLVERYRRRENYRQARFEKDLDQGFEDPLRRSYYLVSRNVLDKVCAVLNRIQGQSNRESNLRKIAHLL
jgi:hypothetical protein